MKESQNDSTLLLRPAEAEVAPPKPVKKTVYRVIRQLPYDATPEQQDSAVQANFHVPPMTWPKGVKLGLPGIKMDDGHAHLPKLDLWDTPFAEALGWKWQKHPYSDRGIAGDPLPYRLRTDDVVTSTLLVGFFLAVWVVSRSIRYLAAQLKDFFYPPERDDTLTTGTGNELKGQIFLIFQTCVVLGLLFFYYTQEKMTDVFNQVSPYKLLLVDIGIFMGYYALKILLYHVVNWVFFEPRARKLWTEAFLLTVLGEGLLLLPVALLVVYFELAYTYAFVAFALVLLALKALLLYKCYQIFFSSWLGALHLFLYFCTLEAVPLIILWRGLVFVNNYMLTIL